MEAQADTVETNNSHEEAVAAIQNVLPRLREERDAEKNETAVPGSPAEAYARSTTA